jgi:hypothetical protein
MKIPFATGDENCRCKGEGKIEISITGMKLRVDCDCVVFKEAKVVIEEYSRDLECLMVEHEGHLEPDD